MATNSKPNGNNRFPYDVSVSIVSYNTDPSELLRAIQSVQNSKLETKVVVVENGATDRAKQVTLENGCEYRFLGRNVGFGAAHNLAIKECVGMSKYHLVLNPDVYFGSGVLESLTTYLNANPEIGLAMPQVLFPDRSVQHLRKLMPTPTDLLLRRLFVGPLKPLLQQRTERYELRNLDSKRILTVPVLSGCFMFLRAEVFNAVGCFDERYFMYLEDVDFCRRIHRAFDLVYYPHVSVFHGYAKGSYKDWTLLWHHVRSAC